MKALNSGAIVTNHVFIFISTPIIQTITFWFMTQEIQNSTIIRLLNNTTLKHEVGTIDPISVFECDLSQLINNIINDWNNFNTWIQEPYIFSSEGGIGEGHCHLDNDLLVYETWIWILMHNTTLVYEWVQLAQFEWEECAITGSRAFVSQPRPQGKP